MRGVFVDEDKVADYKVRLSQVGVDAGVVLGTWGQLRAGPVWSRVDARVDTGSAVLPSGKETSAGLRALLFVDQTDHAWFPTHGFGAVASAYAALPAFGSDASYRRLEATFRGAWSYAHHTIGYAIAAGTDFNSDMPAYESFTLGGPLRLSGYRVNQFAGREYAFGRLMYYNRFLPLPDLLGSGVYAGGSLEVGRMNDRFDGLPSAGTLWSISAFLGADTAVGPAYLGIGLGQSGNWSLYMLLGAP